MQELVLSLDVRRNEICDAILPLDGAFSGGKLKGLPRG